MIDSGGGFGHRPFFSPEICETSSLPACRTRRAFAALVGQLTYPDASFLSACCTCVVQVCITAWNNWNKAILVGQLTYYLRHHVPSKCLEQLEQSVFVLFHLFHAVTKSTQRNFYIFSRQNGGLCSKAFSRQSGGFS